MANLFFGKIDTDRKFVKLSDISEVTFENDVKYQIQALGSVKICISETEPVDEGFLINDCQIWAYKPANVDTQILWIRTQDYPVNINIAE